MGVVFPVDVFKKIGLVDNINFPQYYGDADFTLRAKKNGFKIYCHNKLKLLMTEIQQELSRWFFLKYFQNLFSLRSPFNLKVNIKNLLLNIFQLF